MNALLYVLVVEIPKAFPFMFRALSARVCAYFFGALFS